MLTARTSNDIPPFALSSPSDLSLALTTEFIGLNVAPSWFILGQASDLGIGSVTIFRAVIDGAAISLETFLLRPDDGQTGDRFGSSVVLYRNTSHMILCVGADGRDETGPSSSSALCLISRRCCLCLCSFSPRSDHILDSRHDCLPGQERRSSGDAIWSSPLV
jgi:hypothetical protein